MTGHRFYRYENRETLSKELAAEVLKLLNQELNSRQRAGLVVSGGSTPVPLFAALSASEFDWSRVDITLADERWVDVHSPESNEGLVRQHLLQGKAAVAGFIGLKSNYPTPRAAENACGLRLQAMPQPFAAVILGMGKDGHTASLFPGAPELQAALSPTSSQCCLQITPPHAGQLRMTLTLQALLNTRKVLLHITGDDKLAVYRQALSGDNPLTMPVKAIFQQNKVKVSVYWAP